MNHEIERKFLHDLATPLSVCQLTVKMLMDELAKNEITPELKDKALVRLEKVYKALLKIEEIHATHKINITQPKAP